MNKNDNNIHEIHDYCLDVKNRTIFLHGHDNDEDQGVEFKIANKFLKNLLILDKKDLPIIIHQHSIGGEVTSGMLIFDAISSAQSYTKMICHGECMSMGTIILQACDERLSMPNCQFMLHLGNSGYYNNQNYITSLSWMNYEKKQVEKILNIYLNRCKNGQFFKERSDLYIKKYLNNKFRSKGDWILDAEEAKYYGFIDHIIDTTLKTYVTI